MNGAERNYAHVRFLNLFASLHGEAFEDFFHDVMCAQHPDFLDVRTHGNLGDQGADGLSLHDSKLYACYAPRTIEMTRIEAKFRSDLASALRQRPGQFDTFVFVHNDPRGVHPEVATLLSGARAEHPDLSFEQLGSRGLWNKLIPLPRETVENVLGCEIPVQELVYGIGIADIAPLLEHLRERRATADAMIALDAVSAQKLDFNGITGDVRDDLLRGMQHTYLVTQYYAGVLDPCEHDEVAAGFTEAYLAARKHCTDSDAIMMRLQEHIHGNRLQGSRELKAGWVVLAHFFEHCHVFDNAPAGWAPDSATPQAHGDG